MGRTGRAFLSRTADDFRHALAWAPHRHSFSCSFTSRLPNIRQEVRAGSSMNGHSTSAAAAGILLMIAAVPLVFLALLYGSGGEMISFIQSPTERLWLSALVALPCLLFLLGASLLWASRTASYALCIALSLIMAADVAAFARLEWLQRQPEPRPSFPAPDPNAVIRSAVISKSGNPELTTVECDAKRRRCEAGRLPMIGARRPTPAGSNEIPYVGR